jgi:hypothetical protein
MSPTDFMAVVYWFSPVSPFLKWRELGSMGFPLEAVKSMATEKLMAVPPWIYSRNEVFLCDAIHLSVLIVLIKTFFIDVHFISIYKITCSTFCTWQAAACA